MNSTTLKYMARVFRAPSLEAAVKRAPIVMGWKGMQLVDLERFTLAEAFNATLRASRRSESSRGDWAVAVRRFMVWLGENSPRVLYWDLVSRDAVRTYLEELEGKGLAANSRRLAVQPLIQTSRFMTRERGAPNDLSDLSPGAVLATPTESVFLVDLVSLLEWQRVYRPDHEVGTALCGLAGLRVSEALGLTWDRVDLEEGLVQIVRGKNEYSDRTIPVAGRVVDALKRARTAIARPRGIIDLYGHVVLNGDGEPFEGTMPYRKRFIRGRKQWNPRLTWSPKDLRKCLPTFGAMEGFWSPVCEQYIGHAAKGVTAKYYVPKIAVSSQGEHEALKDAMGVFRDRVVRHIDQAVAAAIMNLSHETGERNVE